MQRRREGSEINKNRLVLHDQRISKFAAFLGSFVQHPDIGS